MRWLGRAKDVLDDGENLGPLPSVELRHQPEQPLERLIGEGVISVSGGSDAGFQPRPLGQRIEVQSIQVRQLKQYERVGSFDDPSLHLGQVRIGPTRNPLHLTQRQPAVLARVAQNAPDQGGRVPFGLGSRRPRLSSLRGRLSGRAFRRYRLGECTRGGHDPTVERRGRAWQSQIERGLRSTWHECIVLRRVAKETANGRG